MRAFDELGLFWLPDHEEQALSGRLQFDPKGEGISLSLVGMFDNVPEDRDQATFRIIGWRGNDKVTLDQCLLRERNPRAPGIAESKYYANQMFVGHHFGREELAFQSASVVVSDLDSWVGRSGIALEEDYPHAPSGTQPIYKMAFTPPPEETCRFSRGRVKLAFGWKPAGDPIHGISFRQWAGIRIEYDQMQKFDTIRKDIGRIQDLVTLCIDAPTAMDSLILQRPDIRVKVLSGEVTDFEQPIEFIAQPLRYVDPQEHKPRHRHQMLLGFEELGGLEAIARWLDASQVFQRALDSFMSIRHARQMYAENRFLNVTFAAEAFHRIVTSGAPYMDEEAFTGLFNVYLANTSEEHHEWLRGRIEHGNEPPLGKRLRQLAARAGAATRPLIGKRDRWAYTLSQVRNELTHIGPDSKEFYGEDLLLLAESVYAVVRICMLMECGVSREILTSKANSSSITWYRERLKGSMERVRSQLAGQ
jgi:ApeA-like protein/HEPN superfamily Apea-like protein